MRPVVSYGAEAWTMTKKDEQALLDFERKIFRRMYGPKYENGEWKGRKNRELEEMSNGENIVKWIKGQRISWLEWRRIGCPKRFSPKNWKGRDEGEDPGTDGKRSRKRSSSAGSEKMERVGDR
jgi:hypothetical protein